MNPRFIRGDAARAAVSSLHRSLLRNDVRCPACDRPVRASDDYLRVHGALFHSECALHRTHWLRVA